MAETQRLRAVARGEVQGVGFRFAVQRLARELGLTGYAQNQRDGSLRVEAEGPPSRLDRLESFLRDGPRLAEVTELNAERGPASGEFVGFEAR